MKKKIFLLLLLFNLRCISQENLQLEKQKYNHIVTLSLNNPVLFSNDKSSIKDWAGYTQNSIAIAPQLGYLFSYKLSDKWDVKAGLYLLSFIKYSFKYYSSTITSSNSDPKIPFFIEYYPFSNSKLFFSAGTTISLELFESIKTYHFPESEFAPETIITRYSENGVNTIISLGIGKRNIFKDKYRFEWLVSYNQGTNSLRSFTFERFEPYAKSIINVNNSHLSLSLRYYFKKQ